MKFIYDDKGYSRDILQSIARPKEQQIIITLNDDKLVSVCPLYNLSDYSRVVINYIPNDKIVELDSFENYLFSMRKEPIFHEDLGQRILDDFVATIDPEYIEVRLVSNSAEQTIPRMQAINLRLFWNYAKSGSKYEEFKEKRFFEYLCEAR